MNLLHINEIYIKCKEYIMEKSVSVILVLLLLFTILSGCKSTVPDPVHSSGDGVTPATSAGGGDEPGAGSSPVVSGGGFETVERELEWWQIYELPDNPEIDPTQTGELTIFVPIDPWPHMTTPVIDLYRTIYPNVELAVEHAGGDFHAFDSFAVRISA